MIAAGQGVGNEIRVIALVAEMKVIERRDRDIDAGLTALVAAAARPAANATANKSSSLASSSLESGHKTAQQ